MQVKDTTVPYPDLNFTLIFNKTKGKYHQGGRTYTPARITDFAKKYKSQDVAITTIKKFDDHDDYVLVNYHCQALNVKAVNLKE